MARESTGNSHASPPLWRVERLAYAYGKTAALNIERLSVRRGRLLCLLGPTGAGKSTLLHLLAGTAVPSRGRIDVGSARSEKANGAPSVAMVYQQPIPLRRSVAENVAYGLKLKRLPCREIETRVKYWLQQLRLAELASRRADRLSGGQLRLLAIARALAIEPEVLLLDEPTANLDPGRVELVEQVVRAEVTRRDCTVVWTTHNLFQARRIADDVALLLGGECIEQADGRTFFDSPADERTKAFLNGDLIY